MRGASSSSVPQWVCVTARPPLHAYRVCPDRIGIHTHARVHCKCLTVCVLARLHSILLLCANSEYHFALPSAFVCSFEDPPPNPNNCSPTNALSFCPLTLLPSTQHQSTRYPLARKGTKRFQHQRRTLVSIFSSPRFSLSPSFHPLLSYYSVITF